MTDKELRQKLAKLIIENPDARVIYEVEDDNIYDDTEVCLNQLQTVALREMAYTNVLGNDYTDPDDPLYLMKDKLDLMDFEDRANYLLSNELQREPTRDEIKVKAKELSDSIEWEKVIFVALTPTEE